jgi:hypothetical protein
MSFRASSGRSLNHTFSSVPEESAEGSKPTSQQKAIKEGMMSLRLCEMLNLYGDATIRVLKCIRSSLHRPGTESIWVFPLAFETWKKWMGVEKSGIGNMQCAASLL